MFFVSRLRRGTIAAWAVAIATMPWIGSAGPTAERPAGDTRSMDDVRRPDEHFNVASHDDAARIATIACEPGPEWVKLRGFKLAFEGATYDSQTTGRPFFEKAATRQGARSPS